MFVDFSETPKCSDCLVTRCSAREERRRRNALARRKLEAHRERELLRKQLTDVWDEPGNHQ